MKPKEFKLNTDYLSLANIENISRTITIPPGVIAAGYDGEYVYNVDISCKSIPMTMIRICIHHNNWSDSSIWGVGNGATSWSDGTNTFVEEMSAAVYSNNKIRFTVMISSGNLPVENPIQVPSHSIKVKIARFRIPNLF